MNAIPGSSAKGRALIRWFFAAAFVLALALSGLFSGLMNKAGLLYLVFGSVAAALMGFTGPEIAGAFRHAAGRTGSGEDRRQSAHFWEAAARNAWMLGALGSALNFTISLGSDSGGLSGIAGRMIQSLVVMLYGLVLAVVCLIPAMKLADGAAVSEIPGGESPTARRAGRPGGSLTSGRVLGYVLFVATIAATILFLMGGAPRGGPLTLGKVLLHGPAILVVFGGATALALFAGPGVGARALTLGFALTGIVALLAGLIQALFGFVHTSIVEISAAVAFIITASSFSLLGLLAVAAPLEDREVMDGRRDRPSPLSRLLWAVFPVLAFVCLVLTFVMVVTPMTKPGG
jgi:hypothetical protein